MINERVFFVRHYFVRYSFYFGRHLKGEVKYQLPYFVIDRTILVGSQ